MRSTVRNGVRLTFAEKLSRLKTRLRDPDWRRYGKLLLVGKMLGIAVLMFTIVVLPRIIESSCTPVSAADSATPPASTAAAPASTAAAPKDSGTAAAAAASGGTAAAPPETKAGDIVNPLNTVWTLVAAFLVFGMQVGFTMLEAGFCRSRETVNVLMECVVDTCLCGLLFWAIGFAFMFSNGNGFIGYHWFFLQDAPTTYKTTAGDSGVAFLAFWIFQFAFADTCSTITSGAMIGRTGFVGDLLYSLAVSGFIYPIIGHWSWGPDGFLSTMGSEGNFLPTLGTGFHDFAGSTVVHTIGGFVALAGSIVLGPRLGRKFKRDGGADETARPDHRRLRRLAPLVRLVRIQPGQHALRHGF